MSIDLSQTPRGGKYCPRCRAMMPLRESVCGQCGHRFRTDVDRPAPTDSPASAPDPLHRTMQFTLPPLSPRSTAPAELSAAQRLPKAPDHLRQYWLPTAALLLLGLGAALVWHARTRPALLEESPAGIWVTTLRGRASANAQVEFRLTPSGGGQFSWSESNSALSSGQRQSGQVPLRWRVNPDKTVTLALTPAVGSDATSKTLAGIWSSHPWPWRRDLAAHRLILGTLVLTEKP